MTKSKKMSKTRQKFDFPMKPKKKKKLLPQMLLLCIRFVAVAFWSEEEVLWRRGSPVTYFGPALDPPLGGIGPKVNTNVKRHEYFIPTKFGKYPSSDSVVKVDYVFLYMHPPFHLNK